MNVHNMNYTRCFFTVMLLLAAFAAPAQHGGTTRLFNDNWKFHKGEAVNAQAAAFNDSGWQTVDLPHDWSIEGPFDSKWASGTGFLPGGIGWYRKTFTLPHDMTGKKIFLYFDGVYKNSEVWVNGNFLGKRPSGFASFRYEITRYLNSGKNTVAVKADHTDFADSRWYTGSGIYRNVYLVAADPVHIEQWGVKFSTPQVSEKSALVNVDVAVLNQSAAAKSVSVWAKLSGKKGAAGTSRVIKLDAASRGSASLSFSVADPVLWSVDQPALYELAVSLVVNGKKTDEVKHQVGIRSYKFEADKGFSLNGTSMKLKGVCIHDDAGALGVAVPPEVWERRLKILKDGGCNAIRLSHNPHADYLYDLMDSLGFLVMDEAFDEWEFGKNKWIEGWNVGTPGKDGYHTYFKEWAERDLADMVKRNYNHPSIILWSIGNEVDYPNDPYSHEVLNGDGPNPQIFGKGYQPAYPPASRIKEIAGQLVAVVKKYDRTRPVTAAFAGVVMSNAVGAPQMMDIAGYNYQEYRYPGDHKQYPERVIYGSENGMGFSAWKAVTDNDYIAGQFLWTGIDYLGEAGRWPVRSNQAGLIDLAGFPKAEYYFRQSLWSEKPVVVIGTSMPPGRAAASTSKRAIFPTWNYKAGDTVRVSAFTNLTETELFLNGRSLGRKSSAEAIEGVITWSAVYQPGELTIKGFKEGKVAGSHTLKTSGDVYGIQTSADRKTLSAAAKGLAHIEIGLVDKDGLPVFSGQNEITVTVEGPAKLLGLESANPVSHEDYQSPKRKAWHGKLLAYVQATGAAGTVRVGLTSPGLAEQLIVLQVK
ncbi:sugar-binding domain-containing protein [Hufsiella ginkgonis]|uniref:DUF4982 domain-containing protein n=1 Tax=Hufsiella ginkgonis TaxID=2695274 RepID=A0A7K1XSA0_9SPHI|nr:sugar-binding domain-containing protein [Hufsiella ginkgonis]MXV13883.1 DUF4982 domain-containing protein [Hufsiella ginkgonis]